MRPQFVLAALISVLLAAPGGLPAGTARAELRVSAGTEHFSWSEQSAPLGVRESGPRFVFGVAVAPRDPSGLHLAYRGRLYVGQVGYDGARLASPTVSASGSTVYTGTTQRGEVRYGFGSVVEAVGGLDLDLWQRQLTVSQSEDYRVLSFRLGAEHGAAARAGWRLGAGLRFPFWTREDAHLTQLGYDQNPILQPGGLPSPYADLAYRVTPHWLVGGYLDGLRFSHSATESLTRRGGVRATITQPASTLRTLGLQLERTF